MSAFLSAWHQPSSVSRNYILVQNACPFVIPLYRYSDIPFPLRHISFAFLIASMHRASMHDCSSLWLFTSFHDVLFLFCLLSGMLSPPLRLLSRHHMPALSVVIETIVPLWLRITFDIFHRKIHFYLHISKICCTFAAAKVSIAYSIDHAWAISTLQRHIRRLLRYVLGSSNPLNFETIVKALQQ